MNEGGLYLDILSVLSDVECATIYKVMEDVGCDHRRSVRRCLELLIDRRLVEHGPRIKGGADRGRRNTYRIHQRLRNRP